MKLYDDQLIVVTGGAGFIGSCVIQYLNEKGLDNIIVVDRLDHTEKWKNLVGKKFVQYLDKDELFEWLKGKESQIEGFIHLGAYSATTLTDGFEVIQNNYRYSQKLARYAISNEHRFIYASSAATYGDGCLGFSDDHDKIEQWLPLNLYGYSKHLFDLWIKKEGLLNAVVGLKYFNVFGPNEAHKGNMASPIANFVEQAQQSQVIRLFASNSSEYSDGMQCRDFIYVKDAARMTCAFLDKSVYGIFNIGRGEAVEWNCIAKGVFNALNISGKIEYIPIPESIQNQYQNYTCASIDKLKKHQLPLPLYSIEEALKEYIQDFLLKGKRW